MDADFYVNMLEEADGNLFWKGVALFYFNLVRLVGWWRWKPKKKD